jgi:hypothetical protein
LLRFSAASRLHNPAPPRSRAGVLFLVWVADAPIAPTHRARGHANGLQRRGNMLLCLEF